MSSKCKKCTLKCPNSKHIAQLMFPKLLPASLSFVLKQRLLVQARFRGMENLRCKLTYHIVLFLQEHSAPLYQHFQAQSFHTSMYASGWFLTLFTTQLPLELSFRIMDRFLLEVSGCIYLVVLSDPRIL